MPLCLDLILEYSKGYDTFLSLFVGGFNAGLKIGYWLCTTPCKLKQWEILGAIVLALTVGFVIKILNEMYRFVGEDSHVAPQANKMSAVIQPLMDQQFARWTLYIVGGLNSSLCFHEE